MTTQTGTAPNRLPTGSVAVPPIALKLSPYRITASVPGRTLATAVRVAGLRHPG